jgi:2'-5' RNA ligase
MSIALVAYPNMASEHYQWIDSIRASYPALKNEPLDPHFTFVFPAPNHLNYEAFSRHIEQVTQQVSAISFVMRCAIPMPDAISHNTHLFLIPDEGMSMMVKLHSALYTNLLAEYLRLDIPFIPHITIGYSENAALCKEVATAINRQALGLAGVIDMLVFLEKKDNKWSRVRDFALIG